MAPSTWEPEVLDAFFRDALKELGPSGPSRRPASPHSAPSPPTSGDQPPRGEQRWSKVISAEALEDEVKELAVQLADDVKSLAHFKAAGYQQARTDFGQLAALFGIIGQYDGQVRWKDQAPALRDLLGLTGQNCKAASDAAYRQAQGRASDLAELVRGGQIELPRPSSEGEAWSTVVERPALMSRLELAQEKRLAGVAADRLKLDRQREAIRHEAQIIAALARLIREPGYEFAEDPNFRRQAVELEQGGIELFGAAGEKNPSAMEAAIRRIGQSCERCHGDFRE
jgi:hypothetical protein